MTAKGPRLPGGNPAAGIYADMSVDGLALGTLVCVVDRAKNLPNRKTLGKQNPYCAARLGKEAKKTETDLRGGQTPKWDQELRFTVHESPDYLKLKVSVFNDDKKTDLIGETWVDLKDLIIPGGSQSDQWHPLQFRGRYAGEIRIEMTYYDTRPEGDALMKRKEAVEKALGKTPSHSGPAAAGPTSSGLSGPRQLNQVKRRPLPSDPTGASTSRPPPPPEKTNSAPAAAPAPSQAPAAAPVAAPSPLPMPMPIQQPTPVRPVAYEHHHSAPPAQTSVSSSDHQRRHAAAADAPYELPSSRGSVSPGLPPTRTYETPDDFHREWEPLPQATNPNHYPQEPLYQQQQQQQQQQHHHHHHHQHQHQHQTQPSSHTENYHDVPYARRSYESLPQPHHHNGYPPAAVEQPRYVRDASPHGGAISRYSPRTMMNSYEPPSAEFPHPSPAPIATDNDGSGGGYRHHSNSVVGPNSPLHSAVNHDAAHTDYASMQPSVEDEEEEGPPPPPPIHRTPIGQSSRQRMPSPAPSYKAYSPEYAASPRTSTDVNMPTSGVSYSSSQSTHNINMQASNRLRDLPPHSNSTVMPPSLMAGYDPAIADAESDRVDHEDRAVRRRSGLYDDELAMVSQPPAPPAPPAPYEAAPAYHARTSPRPPEDVNHGIMVRSRRGSASPDTRIVPRRKSVSPRPPIAADRGSMMGGSSSIPFSPDSYNVINPNAARSAVTRDPAPPYETPAQAMEAAIRSESTPARDLEPIIGDDGRVIDPSDHLPTETWAPEPERKTKKPEVIIRFKNIPKSTPPREVPRETPRASYRSRTGEHGSFSSDRRPHMAMTTMTRSGGDGYGGYTRSRTYSTTTPDRPRSSHRGSVSPSPGSRSPSLYDDGAVGPPIPAKVPVAQPAMQSYPVVASNPGMDALSRELQTIDIGSGGWSDSRAVRKYTPYV
ncbi:hypothetical protein ASPZODRAFT_62030 [Penicilliopsis zonata CBS 506.65]|uniref:C2 domain-containing protein n=1 Tax=Penicilliopsis zonata CBS 506.65 TaxID=1073090 RepID=A0A1L9SNV8_9EURO|nr:hypothetical protein ASPZODRAFT_62030 [Penicilliopsis zonata CBS 506.65]OJJ48727.1 hypothetical protein ASPZODRAFT_62030 [Penicilliopsis zonata CBS 506.65]